MRLIGRDALLRTLDPTLLARVVALRHGLPMRRGVLDVWCGDTKFNEEGGRLLQLHDGRFVPADHRTLDLGLGRGLPVLAGAGAQGWEETLDTITSDGTQISNSTSETIVCPDFNIPAYYMAPGRTLRLWAFGVNSNVVTTPGTLTFRVRWGGVAGTALLVSAAIGLDTTARTNALWALMAHIVCRTSGSTGTFLSGGMASVVNVLASTGISNNGVFNNLVSMLGSAGTPIASGSAAVTVDTTAAKLLSVTATFSVSTNPTNLTCQQRVLEVLN